METWRDHKRYLWLVALLMPLLPFLAIGLFLVTDMAVWLWLGPIVILGIIPLIDLAAGLDPSNPPDDVIATLERDRYYRWLTYLFLPLQYAGFALAFWYIAYGDLTTVNRIGLAVTVGFIGGLGINTAHELGHKKESHERWLSKVALAQTFYGHFYLEPNRGHHVRVATPDDPASARVGESVYAFWPGAVVGSLRNAWDLGRRRYARRGQSPFRLGNDILNAFLMSAALWLVMVAWLGPTILPFLVLQAVVAFTLLEAVNYLEHYGMLRQRVGAPGHERYERVAPRHSWNSNNLTTNVLLYHLQRHSDHHANPTRRYQALRDYEESPALPTGYAGMILLALVPPAWRRVMDHRVIEHVGGDLALANVQPSRLAAYAARYPGPPSQSRGQAESPAVAEAAAGPVVRCPGCGWTYDEAIGDAHEGFPAGTPWTAVPDSFACPDCGVRDKADFVVAAPR